MSDADCTPGHKPRSVAASNFWQGVRVVLPPSEVTGDVLLVGV